jgi:hypothetical protein
MILILLIPHLIRSKSRSERRQRLLSPNILRVPGPHKIPLIAHAEKRGANAIGVVEFLRTLAH